MTHNATEIAEFARKGITVIQRGDKNYPSRLLNLAIPPEVLYARGNTGLLHKPAVAIIGTRDCTRYGKEIATRWAEQFARLGIVVISGLAEGIDTAAHLGAIRAAENNEALCEGAKAMPKTNVNTIAVLGNGVDYYFPSSNKDLQNQIAQNGLVISEYLPNEKSARYYFPQRNRIVAALASAVLIVEADLKSGTMLTKNWALDLGIDVYAVPGQVTSYASRGTNRLIKESPCTAALEPADVLQSFNVTMPNKKEKNTVIQFTFEEKLVLDTLKTDEVHFDDLLEETKFATQKLASLLTNMELSALIKKLPGNMYTAGELVRRK